MRSFGRPEDGLAEATPWYLWGPYLSERAWGTVREDYSAFGAAWEYLPHDHARSRAYRWSEDGMAGVCDVHQRLCLALALWNGRDPILKERCFGLTGNEGNHGEDVKEYWWYLDALPSHAWLRWRYHYPQRAFPYTQLVEGGRRSRLEPELELLDTGAFDDDRYWVVEVAYAKRDPTDLLMRVTVTNAGPEADRLHVLPTLWFRNTWSWNLDVPKPRLGASGSLVVAEQGELGRYALEPAAGPGGAQPELLFCDNETNGERLFGSPGGARYPKDGIGEHVIAGADRVNPARAGTKAAAWYRLDVGPGETVELRLRLHALDGAPSPEPARLGVEFERLMAGREAEADEFYAELAPDDASAEEAMVMRQAFAGMVWGKQFYSYDVGRWLDGDPGQPVPPSGRRGGRNAGWRHFVAFDVMSMPDAWEYPWFAAWDSAFHAVVLAHLDPAFAKYQLVLLCREWFQHPNGALPAYEWSFDDVNPPVQAWAALKVWQIDGGEDFDFLERVFLKLLGNFTWWVNRQDSEGDNVFSGGFLGLDNISVLDRSHLPPGVQLEQSDATGWMAFYCLAMLAIAVRLSEHNPAYADLVLKFLEHFALIGEALDVTGLWDDQDAFYYDVLRSGDGSLIPLKVRSIAGLIPLLPSAVVSRELLERAAALKKALGRFQERHGVTAEALRTAGGLRVGPRGEAALVSVVSPERMRRIVRDVLDERSFLSPHGLRSVSARLRGAPYRIELPGGTAEVDYQPAESQTAMFGGNSNWRGPVWFPLNYLLVDVLARLGEVAGEAASVEYPTGSGSERTLLDVAADLRQRLISLWLRGPDGRRPAYGGVERLQRDPRWSENLLFFEYFHSDNGAGLGAMHQTGWTGLVADLIRGRGLSADPLSGALREQ